MADASRNTRIVCISDTHSQYKFQLPDGDILVHAGDFSRSGGEEEVMRFLTWLKSLTQYRLKVIIAGNHDLTLEPSLYERVWRRWHPRNKQNCARVRDWIHEPALAADYGIIYLQDNTYIDEITGFKFYGSPYRPSHCGRTAFSLPYESREIKQIWSRIPENTDILITHGPPANILDLTEENEHVGCMDLFKRVQRIKPLLHIFGHIHESNGRVEQDQTIFVNASICTKSYRPSQPPIIVDLPIK